MFRLRDNALANSRHDVLDAVHQRLRKAHPKIYRRLVGPLFERKRDSSFKCYCNSPASLISIRDDILNDKVPMDALTCDACWEDLSETWGYYGWAGKQISVSVWQALCTERADHKFVE